MNRGRLLSDAGARYAATSACWLYAAHPARGCGEPRVAEQSGSAPSATRSRTISRFPIHAALWSGVAARLIPTLSWRVAPESSKPSSAIRRTPSSCPALDRALDEAEAALEARAGRTSRVLGVEARPSSARRPATQAAANAETRIEHRPLRAVLEEVRRDLVVPRQDRRLVGRAPVAHTRRRRRPHRARPAAARGRRNPCAPPPRAPRRAGAAAAAACRETARTTDPALRRPRP